MRGRFRGFIALAVVAVTVLVLTQAFADPPVPELGIHPATQLPAVGPGPCTATNDYESELWQDYGDKCKRLRFAFGPIWAKPGQNDVLIEPVTIQKPAYDGYIVRFRPDLVDATGAPPPIEEIHLHHATWLNVYPSYGSGPFFAAGEEKTIATFPPGYGMHVGAADTWLLLYMVHNAISTPRPVWITYDVDFIAEEDAHALGIVPVKPIWLDVQRTPIAPGATDTGGNPVFNVQRGFGSRDDDLFGDASIGGGTGRFVCSWPKENCARHDVYGGVTPQQGVPLTNLRGADWTVGADFEGTLIGIGGHLHPGGIRDEVSLVRQGKGEKPIFFSEAVPWKPGSPNVAGVYDGLTSWDFSMTVTGSTIGWKVKIKEGDILRLNAVYDAQQASWYENMGIVVALVAPKATEREDALHGGPGLDPFDPSGVTLSPGLPTLAKQIPGWPVPSCTPQATGANKTLCLRGQVTHDHMPEASNHGGPQDQALPAVQGPVVNELVSVGFTYGAADFGVIGTTGIPRLMVNQPARFWNVDSPLDIWHTWTRCKEPCTGPTGISFPLANGGSGQRDPMDFDSTEIGYGLFFSPASGQFGTSNKSTDEALRDGLFWEFTPTQTGVYSLFCRIHPFMRGAFEVVSQ